mmetsp:Transcript_10561/g.23785  ORF Transcript_10561/g.23785 Transcript_10561/m.23785 type:complete len:243 (+) Transcript_10561:44-772(+)
MCLLSVPHIIAACEVHPSRPVIPFDSVLNSARVNESDSGQTSTRPAPLASPAVACAASPRQSLGSGKLRGSQRQRRHLAPGASLCGRACLGSGCVEAPRLSASQPTQSGTGHGRCPASAVALRHAGRCCLLLPQASSCGQPLLQLPSVSPSRSPHPGCVCDPLSAQLRAELAPGPRRPSALSCRPPASPSLRSGAPAPEQQPPVLGRGPGSWPASPPKPLVLRVPLALRRRPLHHQPTPIVQ